MTIKAIAIGDRGPAVEDIQRRLLLLGYRLGSSGVDGVFLEDTQKAIESFQERLTLPVTGTVDDHTWSALVDSSFAFGDRLLYLRAPRFHGSDVAQLQEALNSLGFYCGPIDAIFGTWTERAVSEFQANSALGSDGVVGAATFDALAALRHIWGGKNVPAHSAAAGGPRVRNAILADCVIELVALDGDSYRIARRVANLAQAAHDQAQVKVRRVTEQEADDPAQSALPSSQTFEGEALVRPVLCMKLAHTTAGIAVSGDRNLLLPIPHDFTMQGSQQGFQHLAAAILDVICRS